MIINKLLLIRQKLIYQNLDVKKTINTTGDVRIDNGMYRDKKEQDKYLKKSLNRKLP